MAFTKKTKAVKKITLKKQVHRQRINLQCSLLHGDVVSEVRITNNTDKVIPKGETIHWEVVGGNNGSHTLQSPLNPGIMISPDDNEPNSASSCKAWFNPGPDFSVMPKLIPSGSSE
jgi:hypothetical protein